MNGHWTEEELFMYNMLVSSLGCPLREFITEPMHRAAAIGFQSCKFQYECILAQTSISVALS